MTRRGVVRGVVLIALLVAWPAGAQDARPMTMVDLLNVSRIGEPQLSPDGQEIVFVKSGADWTANERISHVWRVRTDGSSRRQLTNGAQGEDHPRWSPDGKTIAFVAKRGEGDEEDAPSQMWVIRNDGGEARQLTSHETSVSAVSWAPDGWRELRHELFKMNVDLAWFEKYVTEREYTWETAPGGEEKEKEKTAASTNDRS